MQIIAKCPKCANTLYLDASAADKRIRCLRCNRLIKIPKLEDLPQATKLIKQAKGTIYVDQDGNIYG